MTEEIWEPAVGDEVAIIGGSYREEARLRRVERLTATLIIVEGEGTRFKRQKVSHLGEEVYYPGQQSRDSWHPAPRLHRPSDFRVRRILAETEERQAAVNVRHQAELLEKDPRRPGGIHQVQEGIKRLERAVAAMDLIYDERPDIRRPLPEHLR
jgi:hypothetical protein